MPRQFGLSHREAVGGNQLPGARYARDTQRDPLPPLPGGSLSRGDFFERSEISQSSLDERELGSCIFFLTFLSLVGGILLVGYVSLQSFNP